MTLQVKIAVRAVSQVRQASVWWVRNRSAAVGAIHADFGEAVALPAQQPGIGARYQGAKTPGVQRLFLGRVGYFVYYRVDKDVLQVLALWHASRDEQPVL